MSSCGLHQARGTEASPLAAHGSVLLMPNSQQLCRGPESNANVNKIRFRFKKIKTFLVTETDLIEHNLRSYVFGCTSKCPCFTIW